MEARIGVLTVSDTRSSSTDRSGPAVVEALSEIGEFEFEMRLVPDEVDGISQALLDLCERCQVIFTTGGTGFTPRDVTPEATALVIDRRADSLSELMRLRGLEQTPLSHLSRGIAGIRGQVLIVNLPGSPRGAAHGIHSLAPLIPGLLESVQGGGKHHE